MAYGRDGFAELFARQVRLARGISRFLDENPGYTLLGQTSAPSALLDKDNSTLIVPFQKTHIIVLFRAKRDEVNTNLVKRINATRKMYVSGTKWDGHPACRIAVSTWKVDVERDLKLVTEVLQYVLKGSSWP